MHPRKNTLIGRAISTGRLRSPAASGVPRARKTPMPKPWTRIQEAPAVPVHNQTQAVRSPRAHGIAADLSPEVEAISPLRDTAGNAGVGTHFKRFPAFPLIEEHAGGFSTSDAYQ